MNLLQLFLFFSTNETNDENLYYNDSIYTCGSCRDAAKTIYSSEILLAEYH